MYVYIIYRHLIGIHIKSSKCVRLVERKINMYLSKFVKFAFKSNNSTIYEILHVEKKVNKI